jgi:SAM-dependent methyltransferase
MNNNESPHKEKSDPDPGYTLSHQQPGKGRGYDEHYDKQHHRRFLWRREQIALDDILNTFFTGQEIRLLDFACGTGRITEYLESRVASAVGVDVSPDMLQQAREKLARTEILQADLTQNNVLAGRKFNLITAFRFFLNAEPSLRTRVMVTLASLLDDEGLLVFNNHRNLSSPLLRMRYNLKRTQKNFMTIPQMHDLAAAAGLEIIRIYPIGFFPLLKNKMPFFLNHAIDNVASRCGCLRNYSESPIAVCRKKMPGSQK